MSIIKRNRKFNEKSVNCQLVCFLSSSSSSVVCSRGISCQRDNAPKTCHFVNLSSLSGRKVFFASWQQCRQRPPLRVPSETHRNSRLRCFPPRARLPIELEQWTGVFRRSHRVHPVSHFLCRLVRCSNNRTARAQQMTAAGVIWSANNPFKHGSSVFRCSLECDSVANFKTVGVRESLSSSIPMQVGLRRRRHRLSVVVWWYWMFT